MDFSFSFNFDEFLVIDIDGHSVFTFLVYGHCKGELPLWVHHRCLIYLLIFMLQEIWMYLQTWRSGKNTCRKDITSIGSKNHEELTIDSVHLLRSCWDSFAKPGSLPLLWTSKNMSSVVDRRCCTTPHARKERRSLHPLLSMPCQQNSFGRWPIVADLSSRSLQTTPFSFRRMLLITCTGVTCRWPLGTIDADIRHSLEGKREDRGFPKCTSTNMCSAWCFPFQHEQLKGWLEPEFCLAIVSFGNKPPFTLTPESSKQWMTCVISCVYQSMSVRFSQMLVGREWNRGYNAEWNCHSYAGML